MQDKKLTHKTERAPKNSVTIELYRGKYRLRWTHDGERYSISTGMTEGAEGLIFARGIANSIEVDIRLGGFDKTLSAYKPHNDDEPRHSDSSILELWDEFVRLRSRTLDPDTIKTAYNYVRRDLEAFFGTNKKPNKILPSDADAFIENLKKNFEPVSVRKKLFLISAFWMWMIEARIAVDNPWKKRISEVKKGVKKQIAPFTKVEIEAILRVFKEHEYYSHYYPFVSFLFATGCRTGEAMGIQWKNIIYPINATTDSLPILAYIESSLSAGKMKGTKTGVNRHVPLSASIAQILESIKPVAVSKNELVFKAPRGGVIVSSRFCDRIWKEALAEAGVSWRRLYNTRHTFISHALDQGIKPINVASITGHDVATLFKHYAGAVGMDRMPDII